VAVKVLAESTPGSQRRLERFRREARSIAQLSHPNILAIHDFGDHESFPYAVTELLDGEDLAHRMKHGTLSVREAVGLAAAVADGLAAAHRRAILHRDIKPHNIFLTTDGEVKILDFGLARSTDRADREERTETAGPDLTEAGAVVGTTAYMSPEQVRGEAVDHRTDLFSLGAVLYEALTGTHPFKRGSRMDTVSAILRDEPPPPSTIRREISPALDEIVLRCLRKSADQRFESAADLAFALKSSPGLAVEPDRTARAPGRRWWPVIAALAGVAVAGAAAVALRHQALPELPETKRMVIMRFQPAVDDSELRALAAGLTEVVAAGLAVAVESADDVAWLRPQVPENRPAPGELREVAREFNPNLAVAATLDRTGDRLRLSLEALDPMTGVILRETALEEGTGNPRALQIEPVLRVVEMLGIDVNPETTELLEARTTHVTAAFEAYLRGVGELALAQEAAAIERALERLDQAAESDPLFAPPRLAIAGGCLRLFRATGDAAWLERGKAEASSAAKLRGFEGESLAALGSLEDIAGDLDAAIGASERAVAAAPLDAEARVQLARLLHRAGRSGDAERELEHAMFLRPGYWPDHYWMASFHIAAARYDAAVNEFRRVIELAPSYLGGYTNLGTMYAYLDQPDRAREVFEQSLKVQPDDNYAALTNLGTLDFEEGRYADAAAMFERALEVEDGDYQVWGNLGHAHVLGGRPQQADAPLRRAVELAHEELRLRPNDPEVLCHLAGYHADLGERDAGIAALEAAIAQAPADPLLIADIAHTFEDLDQRERALEWVERAFANGVSPDYFDEQAALRDLLADKRYRELADEQRGKPR
jgi:tetratricopeptide (TPR) repeat protein